MQEQKASSHSQIHKQTDTHTQTNTHGRGRQGRSEGSPDGQREPQCPHTLTCHMLSHLYPHGTAPQPQGRTHAHTRVYTHMHSISLTPCLLGMTHKLPTPIVFTRGCRTFVHLSRVCVDGLLWLLETFREDITSALHFQLSAYLTLRWSSPRHSALLNMLFDTGTHSANLRSTT